MKNEVHISGFAHPLVFNASATLIENMFINWTLFAVCLFCAGFAGCAGGDPRGRPDGSVEQDATKEQDAMLVPDGEVVCSSSTCPNGCCDSDRECLSGAHDNACGDMGAACVDCSADGRYCLDGDCVELGECDAGETMECGNCGTRVCQADKSWGPCENTGDCSPGVLEIIGECGDCGNMQRTCSAACEWGPAACVDEGECSPGDVEQGLSCGQCQVEERVCDPDTCIWSGWECVGQVECNPGDIETSETPCGNCGHERRTCETDCEWGNWTCANEGECQPGAQTGLGCEPCGTKTCDGLCSWGSCVIPVEITDHNTTYTILSGHNSTCNGSSERWGINCNNAIHNFCRAQSCPESGFGPVENVDDNVNVICISGAAQAVTVSYSVLSTHHSGCDGSSQQMGSECNSAIHRYCTSEGYISGFGPVAVSGNDATVTCVSIGEVRSVEFSTLASHHPPCDGTTERIGPNCSAAVNRYCKSLGRTAGFGPVENNQSTAYVTCIQP